jgi:acyl carrier protein
MTITRDSIYSKLQDVFDSVFEEPVEVKPELTAHDVQDWDSVTHVTLVIAVEKAFRIRFSASEINNFKNVDAMVSRIATLAGQ